MTNNLKEFLEYVSEHEELMARVKAINEQSSDKDAMVDAAIACAGENGFSLTRADFNEEIQELTDDELLSVAGGSVCACPAIGGGGASDNVGKREGTCFCMVGGIGLIETYGDHMDARCFCAAAGGGTDKVIAGK